MKLPLREFGSSGLKVTALGFGAGHIGSSPAIAGYSEKEAEYLLNYILDSGINLIDTARGYDLSEERIGKYLYRRRSEFILSTKIGYGIPGHNDWTYDIIIAGVDEALRILRTDYIDIVHLHSCPLETLKRGEVIEALLKTMEAGKVKVAAYSGENENLEYAISTGKFGSIQTSVNITDQRGIDWSLPKAKEKRMGVIAKRPIANAPWRFFERPVGNYCEEYWLRWKKMSGSSRMDLDIDWHELFIRFAAFAEGVDACIVGTSKPEHLKLNVDFVKKGKLPDEIYKKIRQTFKANDDNWIGLL